MRVQLVAVAFAMALSSASVSAGEAEDKIFSLTSALKARYLSDTGDLKLLTLDLESKLGDVLGSGSKCSKRRARDLSRAYRGVLDSVAAGNARSIYESAKALNFHAHQRSSMFTRCWNHMVGRAKALGEVFDVGTQVILVGAGEGW